ncbi:Rieske 2Fe-2S domain-containing protein [Streptomyces thermolilacinus]
MPVVTFAANGRDNCVIVSGSAYVYATVRGQGFVMDAQCPHRGGPLHLAEASPDGTRLVCPWHDRGTSVARLRAAIPAVRVGNRVTAVFPDRPRPRAGAPGSAPCGEVTREYRPLAPGLARPAR